MIPITVPYSAVLCQLYSPPYEIFLFEKVSQDFNVTIFPTVLLFEAGNYKKYPKDLKSVANFTKSAERLKQWIIERLEANDRIVIKEITSDAFKTSPDDFKHVSYRFNQNKPSGA